MSIIILKRRFIDVELPKPRTEFGGFYNLRVLKNNKVKHETGWFPNIILDSGLNRWGSGGIISGAAIGTGTSTPNATQTGLDTQVHWTTTTGNGHSATSVAGASPYNNSRVAVYRTTLGSLNGNYSEVGVGWATGPYMFSRALILDGLGAPTTISVLSDEQLEIQYRLEYYPPLVDWSGTVNISGVDYDVIGRASDVNNVIWSMPSFGSAIAVSDSYTFHRAYNGALGVITGTPSGTSDWCTSYGTDAYSNNSLNRTGYSNFGLDDGNVAGGVRSSTILWSTTCMFQYEFDPVIPKDNTKTLRLNYSVTWARRTGSP